MQLKAEEYAQLSIIVLKALASHKCVKTVRSKTKRAKLSVSFVIQVTLVLLESKHYVPHSMSATILKPKLIRMVSFVLEELMRIPHRSDSNHIITVRHVPQPSSARLVELFLSAQLDTFVLREQTPTNLILLIRLTRVPMDTGVLKVLKHQLGAHLGHSR